MAVAYATVDDLAAWLPDGQAVPADADRLLERASELIDVVVVAPFPMAADGLPLEQHVAEAMRDATCAVVEAWGEVGEANDIDGLAGTTIVLGGAYHGDRAPAVAPRAARLLRAAGLDRDLASLGWGW